jgi:hypothetical protein
MTKDKKTVAAISAVMSYINQEQAMTAQPVAETAPRFSAMVPPVRMWGVSGRQAQMQFRNQMQLKMFHGARLR